MGILLLTFAIAALGGYIGVKLKLPAGTIIGALVAVAVGSLTLGLPVIPNEFKVITQIVAGAFIGTSFDRKSLLALKQLILPAAIIISFFVVVNLLTGCLLHSVSSLDLCTSLFATVPGGLTEMSIIADDMGADTAIVSVFQIARLVFTVCLFPMLIARVHHADRQHGEKGGASEKQLWNVHTKEDYLHLLITTAIAVPAGLLGKISGFPGGTLLFAVCAVSFYQVKTGHAQMPPLLRRGTQVIAGALIGCKITWQVVGSVAQLWPYVLMIVTIYMLCSLLLGWILSNATRLDPLTATFSSTPAGASDMALIASDFGTVTPTIAALQLARMIGVIALCPSAITLLLSLF